MAFGGTVGKVANPGHADIDASLEAIRSMEADAEKLHADDKLTVEGYAKMKTAAGENLRNVEKVLKKASPEKRAKLIVQYGLDGQFDSDGSINADFAARNGFSVEGETVTGTQKTHRSEFSAYQSPSLMQNNESVKQTMAQITEELRQKDIENGGTGQVQAVERFSGELDEASRRAYSQFKKAFHTLNQEAGGKLSYVLVKPNSEFDGVRVGNTVYISADTLADGSWKGTLIHEITHATEGTKAYDKYIALLEKDESLVESAMDTVIHKKDYGFSDELAERVTAKMSGAAGLDGSAQVSYNKKQKAENTVVIEADSELAQRIATSSKSKYTVIRDYLVEKFYGQTFTLSDGKKAIMDKRDAQELSHKADDLKTAELSNLRELIEKAQYSHSALNVIHNKFSDFHYYGITVQFEGQNHSLLLNVGCSKNDGTYHIYDITKNRRTANQSATGLSRPVGHAMKNSSSTDSIADSEGKVNREGEKILTDEEQSFVAEVGAHMSEQLLGTDEAFIERLVRNDTTMAEKALNRITDLRRSFASFKSPEARREYRRLHKAEQLYLRAISAAGMTYRNGKITRREEDEKVQYNRIESEYDYSNLSREDYYQNSKIYSYDFLVNQKDMVIATLPEISDIVEENGKINRGNIVSKALANAKNNGEQIDGIICVKNDYTGRLYSFSTEAIKHSLNGDRNRLLTNSRIATIAGEIVKNGIPINALKNKADNVEGTYAIAALNKDSKGNQYIAIVTVEQRTNQVLDIQDYDVIHSVSARQKNSRDARSDSMSPGIIPPTNISATISITQFLNIVNTTYQSILSDDVLKHLNSQRDPAGYYSDRVMFSKKANSSTASETSQAMKQVSDEIRQEIAKKSATQTTGQKAYAHANQNQGKVYTKQDAKEVIHSVLENRLDFGEFKGKIKGKTRERAINQIWTAMNQAPAGKRGGVALDLAEYILQSAILENVYEDPALTDRQQIAMERLELLRPYFHRIDLEGIRGEIKYRFDDRSKSVFSTFGRWQGRSAVTADQMADALSEQGWQIEADNEADAFFEIYDAYLEARRILQESKTTYLNQTLTKEERETLKQDIAKEILRGFDNTGSDSALNKTINRYEKIVDGLKEKLKENRQLKENLDAAYQSNQRLSRELKKTQEVSEKAKERAKTATQDRKAETERNKLIGTLMHQAGKMKDLKTGAFLNASQYKGEEFRSTVEQLARINWRGNLNVTGTYGGRELYKTKSGDVSPLFLLIIQRLLQIINAGLNPCNKILLFFVGNFSA